MLYEPVIKSDNQRLFNRPGRPFPSSLTVLCRGFSRKARGCKKPKAALFSIAVLLLLPSFPGGDVLSQSPQGKPVPGAAKETAAGKIPGGEKAADPCSSPCTNRARAPMVTPAEVVGGRLLLECASVHFGGFIPGYGGFEIFGVGRANCPVVETYVPSHYGSVPAPCKDCEWQDGATIRERENTCSQQLNFIFFAMPNCARGVWVNTSERVRTCSRERTCHRTDPRDWPPRKGER